MSNVISDDNNLDELLKVRLLLRWISIGFTPTKENIEKGRTFLNNYKEFSRDNDFKNTEITTPMSVMKAADIGIIVDEDLCYRAINDINDFIDECKSYDKENNYSLMREK